MHRALGRVAVLALCLLAANSVLAGGITNRGTASPASQTIFSIDTPADGATVFGIVEVGGYVLDARDVSRITLLIDGAAVHDADINQPRVDVGRKYGRYFGLDFPASPGFVSSFLATNYPDGHHALSVRVTFSTGEVVVLGNVSVTVDNAKNQPPVGALDIPANITGSTDYVSGVYPVTGWVLDDHAVRKTVAADGSIRADIEVMVDGKVVGQAIYPLPRPDVANAHPDVPGAMNSGFLMNLDTASFTNGTHTIAVRAWDDQSANSILGSATVSINNTYATLGPIGKIDWPMANGYLYSTGCFYANPPSGIEYTTGDFINWVSGWVVDQNDNPRYEGVKYVELLLDGAILKSTSTDCKYELLSCPQVYSAEVNCYGKERPDILYEYPLFGADAKNSGFFFAIDGDWLLFGMKVHRGLHYLSARVGTQDPNRPAKVIDQIPVIVTCNDAGDTPAYGELERPTFLQGMRGTELVKGWVIDQNGGVKQLNFYVDGILDGSLLASTSTKINMQRLDVQAKYPWLPYPYSLFNGFEYNLDTTKYVDGTHQLVIESYDTAGYHNYWVQRAVVFNNLNRP